jgi:hypothetical protein
MRGYYDFSGAVRGKYAGKVDTTEIRRLDATKPIQKNGASRKINGDRPEGGRHDIDGEIQHRRGDTVIGTLRKTYGPNFAPGVPSDTRLDTLRKRAGGKSLSKLLKK